MCVRSRLTSEIIANQGQSRTMSSHSLFRTERRGVGRAEGTRDRPARYCWRLRYPLAMLHDKLNESFTVQCLDKNKENN